MGVSMAFEASCEHCMRPAEAEGWIEHSAVRVLSKSSALQWECHLSNGIEFFSWAAQHCTAAQNAGYNTIPSSCCGACPERPLADIGMISSMPRAAVGALTFPSEQVERQLRKIVADRLS